MNRASWYGVVVMCAAVCAVVPVSAVSQQPASAKPALDTSDVEAVQRWLGAHAIPLKSVQAGAGFDDLRPLETTLRGVRLVGLGEATHGTREFFQFKHRMLEFLVERMGFRVFAIEASFAACETINDYVLAGKGDRAAALASQGFWTWDTHEVADMIDWMRAYNSHVTDANKVQFVGYDIQNYNRSFDVIAAYLDRVAPRYLPTAKLAFKALQPNSETGKLGFDKRSGEVKATELSRLWELYDFLEAHGEQFVQRTSAAEFEQVLQHARGLLQFDDAFNRVDLDTANLAESTSALRDRYMAENIQHLLSAEPPKTRMVVWAHNGHIQADSSDPPTMGRYLRDAFGKAYYAFGFEFDSGSFQSRELLGQDLSAMGTGHGIGALREFTVGPAAPGSVAWYLERARQGKPFSNYIVALRSAPTDGPVGRWLSSPHLMFAVGAVFSDSMPPDQYMAPTVLREAFDGLIFIEKTTRAQPNPTAISATR